LELLAEKSAVGMQDYGLTLVN